MADQDLNIKVVTTADTTGLKETSAGMSDIEQRMAAIQAQRAQIEKIAEAAAAKFAALDPTKSAAAQLAAAGAVYDPVSKTFKSVEESAGKAAESTRKLSESAGHTGISMAKAKYEAMTLVRELATGAPSMRTFGALVGALGPAFTAAGVGGLVVFEQIRRMREENQKLIAETAALGAEFEKAAMSAQNLVTGARGTGDISRVAQSVIPELEKIHERANDLSKQTIGSIKSTIEDFREGIVAMSPYVSEAMRQWAHPYTIELREAQRVAQEAAHFADVNAKRQIERAQDFTRQFEKLKSLPVEEAANRLLGIIKEQTTLQQNLSKEGEDYAKSWLVAQTNIDHAKEDLQEILKFQAASADKQIEIDNARADGNEALARSLERQRNLLKETIALMAQGLSYEEALAKAKAKSEAAERAKGIAGSGAGAQVQAVLRNEEAARKARAAGQERDADMFEKSARQYEESITGAQKAELARVREARGEKAPGAPAEPIAGGRKAGVGESQELVNQIEKNRLAAEKQRVEAGAGGPGLIGAEAEAARGAALSKTAEESRKAEIERQQQIANTAAASKKAEEERKAAVEEERKRQTPEKQPGTASAEEIKENTKWLQKLYQLWA